VNEMAKKKTDEDKTDPTMGTVQSEEPRGDTWCVMPMPNGQSSLADQARALLAALEADKAETRAEDLAAAVASWSGNYQDSRTGRLSALLEHGKFAEAHSEVELQLAAIEGPAPVKSWGKTRGNGNRRH
jgi:hypothetical protein